MLPLSPDAPTPPLSASLLGSKRRDSGFKGSSTVVRTNCYEITKLPKSIFHYDVDIVDPNAKDGDEEKILLRRNYSVMDEVQTRLLPKVFEPPAAYDGKKNLFAPRALKFSNPSGVTIQVYMGPRDAQGNEIPRRDGTKTFLTMRITFVHEVTLDALNNFTRGVCYPNAQASTAGLTALTMLNVLVRMGPLKTFNYTATSRSIFTRAEVKDLKCGLELCRGFFQSVRPAIGRLVINIDVATGVIVQPGCLLEVAGRFLDCRGDWSLTDRQSQRLKPFVKHLRVQLNIGSAQQRKRILTIRDLVKENASQYTFMKEMPDGDERRVSIKEHIEAAYQRTLRFPRGLCVQTGKTAVYPAEVLDILPGQLYKKALPERANIKPDMLAFSSRRPAERLQLIQSAFEKKAMDYDNSPYLRPAGMAISNAAIVVKGRTLKSPLLYCKTPAAPVTLEIVNGSWERSLKRLQYFNPASIGHWAIVNLDPNFSSYQEGIAQFSAVLHRGMNSLGIRTGPPTIFPANSINEDIGLTLAKVCGEMKKNSQAPSLLVVILPVAAPEVRNDVKFASEVTLGIPIQCIDGKTMAEKLNKPGSADMYCANLNLKINSKAGGINFRFSAELPIFNRKNDGWTLVIGLDVAHAGPGSTQPSFAGMVYSLDTTYAHYGAQSSVQERGQEDIEDLSSMFTKAFVHLAKTNAPPPKRILVFRDGISEGQFQPVTTMEVSQIKEACVKCRVPTPQITYVVVGKRHHVRFVGEPRDNDEKTGNLRPGFVVDSNIVQPYGFDFYLQSQRGLKGTSRPAHYSLMIDEIGIGADDLQEISFALCHVYARANSIVSIPAPVYYADRVCDYARYRLRDPRDNMTHVSDSSNPTPIQQLKSWFQPVHPNLAGKMYFV